MALRLRLREVAGPLNHLQCLGPFGRQIKGRPSLECLLKVAALLPQPIPQAWGAQPRLRGREMMLNLLQSGRTLTTPELMHSKTKLFAELSMALTNCSCSYSNDVDPENIFSERSQRSVRIRHADQTSAYRRLALCKIPIPINVPDVLIPVGAASWVLVGRCKGAPESEIFAYAKPALFSSQNLTGFQIGQCTVSGTHACSKDQMAKS